MKVKVGDKVKHYKKTIDKNKNYVTKQRKEPSLACIRTFLMWYLMGSITVNRSHIVCWMRKGMNV